MPVECMFSNRLPDLYQMADDRPSGRKKMNRVLVMKTFSLLQRTIWTMQCL